MYDPYAGKKPVEKALGIQKARRSFHLAAQGGEWTGTYTHNLEAGKAPAPQARRPAATPVDTPATRAARDRAARRRIQQET